MQNTSPETLLQPSRRLVMLERETRQSHWVSINKLGFHVGCCVRPTRGQSRAALRAARIVNDSTTHKDGFDAYAQQRGTSRRCRQVYDLVRAGGLSAHKLTNGTYAIYPGELLRVFSRTRRLPEPPQLWRSAKQSASRF